MSPQEKAERAKEIVVEMQTLEQKLIGLFGDGDEEEEEEVIPAPKRKYTKRQPSSSDDENGEGEGRAYKPKIDKADPEFDAAMRPEIKEKVKRHFAEKPCCGSRGPRHKTECAGAANHGVKEPTFGLMVLKCLGCGFCFKFKGEKMDAVCPECRKTQVYPSATPPYNDAVYEPEQT